MLSFFFFVTLSKLRKRGFATTQALKSYPYRASMRDAKDTYEEFESNEFARGLSELFYR